MSPDVSELLKRADRLLRVAEFGPIARSSAEAYTLLAERIDAERRAAGAAWRGPEGVENPRSAAVRRAAWARRTHVEVAAALRDLRERRVSVAAALARLKEWVPLAEACPPRPARAGELPRGGRPAVSSPPTRSKRAQLAALPADWMDRLWASAVSRGYRHADALAVLLATGCRPAEATWGCAVRRIPDGVEISLASAKVTTETGQPWRTLSVALDRGGPVEHLARLADEAGGLARIPPMSSPASLSMAVADLGAELAPGIRISAYSVRHQRCADARNALGGDGEKLAAWLGHTSHATARHYARLPRAAGCRGARPLDARAPREVRMRPPRGTLEPLAAATP